MTVKCILVKTASGFRPPITRFRFVIKPSPFLDVLRKRIGLLENQMIRIDNTDRIFIPAGERGRTERDECCF